MLSSWWVHFGHLPSQNKGDWFLCYGRRTTLKNLLRYRVLYIPLHQVNHWTCIKVDVPGRKMGYYDPYGTARSAPQHDIALVATQLKLEASRLEEGDAEYEKRDKFEFEDWTVSVVAVGEDNRQPGGNSK